MWLLLAFLSATLLGFYDVFKKKSLKDNAVLPVLFLNTFKSYLPAVYSVFCISTGLVGWNDIQCSGCGMGTA
jgi:transporter family protein